MQQFTVPQFIDVEDKIIGPITVRQFLIMIVGGVLIFICYHAFDFELFVTLAVLIIAVVIIVAFVRINGAPFHYFLLNFLQTLKNPRTRVWNNSSQTTYFEFEAAAPESVDSKSVQRRYSASRLTELSLIVDTQGVYQGERGQEEFKIKFSGHEKSPTGQELLTLSNIKNTDIYGK